jgi:hypothetical protein
MGHRNQLHHCASQPINQPASKPANKSTSKHQLFTPQLKQYHHPLATGHPRT